jgi:hypothetical protein
VAVLIMAKVRTMDGLPSTSVKVAFTLIRSKARPVPPLAHRLRISATNRTRIVDESGRSDEYQRDEFATDPVLSNYAHGARVRA